MVRGSKLTPAWDLGSLNTSFVLDGIADCFGISTETNLDELLVSEVEVEY